MTEGRLSPIKTKELRGIILFFLHKIYPEEVERTSIHSSFYQYWKIVDIDKAIGYLTDKGYIDRREMKSPFGGPFDMLEYFKITPDGIDVCEETVEDEGVLTAIGR